MKSYSVAIIAALVAFTISTVRWESHAATPGKYLVILQAGKESHEGLARALHALLYAKELDEHGHEVVLVFDGAGTEWAAEWTDPKSQHKLAPMYRALSEKGLTRIVCDFCAGAFQNKEELQKHQAPLVDEYQGHPSIAKWADRGYQILIL